MRWTVVWKTRVQARLAMLWLQAPDRELIRAAADAIDKELSTNADRKGEEFYGDRLLVVAPWRRCFPSAQMTAWRR
jgi:hypothetical protein